MFHLAGQIAVGFFWSESGLMHVELREDVLLHEIFEGHAAEYLDLLKIDFVSNFSVRV